MRKTRSKLLILFIALFIALGTSFAFYYYQVSSEKEDNLKNAVEQISDGLNNAAEQLNEVDGNEEDNQYRITHALINVSTSQGWIEAYEKDMPRNLVSWIGGMNTGLANGAYGVEKGGFEDTKEAIINFNKGYTEIGYSNSNDDPYKSLDDMEEVISSKKYMGENYVNKEKK